MLLFLTITLVIAAVMFTTGFFLTSRYKSTITKAYNTAFNSIEKRIDNYKNNIQHDVIDELSELANEQSEDTDEKNES